MYPLDQLGGVAHGADDDVDPVPAAHVEVGGEFLRGQPGGEVDRDRPDPGGRVAGGVLIERGADPGQPLLELLKRPGVLPGQAADDPGPARLADQVGPGDQEHRCAHGWQAQPGAQGRVE